MMKILYDVKKISLTILRIMLSTAVAILVIDVLLGVASRYIWGEQIKWTEELATVLLVWVSFLGIAAAFEKKAHLGIDMLTSRFAKDARKKMIFIAHIITITFVAVVFMLGGIILVRQAVVNWNIMPALQVSDVIMYLPLPVSGVFVIIYEMANMADDLHNLEGENHNG